MARARQQASADGETWINRAIESDRHLPQSGVILGSHMPVPRRARNCSAPALVLAVNSFHSGLVRQILMGKIEPVGTTRLQILPGFAGVATGDGTGYWPATPKRAAAAIKPMTFIRPPYATT